MVGTFRKDFEPVADVENVVGLIYATGAIEYRRVEFVEPLPEHEHDFGAIAAGASTGPKQIEELKMGGKWLSQLRIFIVTANIEIEAWQPKATGKWATAKKMFRVTEHIPLDHSQVTEHFIFEDRVPFYDAFNVGTTDVTASYVRFRGFKFLLSDKIEKPPQVIYIPIESRA